MDKVKYVILFHGQLLHSIDPLRFTRKTLESWRTDDKVAACAMKLLLFDSYDLRCDVLPVDWSHDAIYPEIGADQRFSPPEQFQDHLLNELCHAAKCHLYDVINEDRRQSAREGKTP